MKSLGELMLDKSPHLFSGLPIRLTGFDRGSSRTVIIKLNDQDHILGYIGRTDSPEGYFFVSSGRDVELEKEFIKEMRRRYNLYVEGYADPVEHFRKLIK